LQAGAVVVDQWQRTSVEHVLCAGEPTGIGGLERSLIEGQIAGYAAAGDESRARSLFSKRAAAHLFAGALEAAFALRDDLKAVASAETIVCRCEDVRRGHLAPYQDWRAAKLQTRCGMGPCQGRICGPACAFLFGWEHAQRQKRPPVFPADMATLADAVERQ
jgi:NADPH-dependent 2,4-dienoyl-CoA reductase/sulfur reductase-like enzyme